jgi:arsenate reductase
MAEAMARKYGSDVINPASAGLSAVAVSYPLTKSILLEKNVDPGIHIPRRFTDMKLKNFDLIVNMSGETLPMDAGVPVEVWEIEDPFGRTEETFRKVRDEIEMRVMHLILRIRTQKFDSQAVVSRQ